MAMAAISPWLLYLCEVKCPISIAFGFEGLQYIHMYVVYIDFKVHAGSRSLYSPLFACFKVCLTLSFINRPVYPKFNKGGKSKVMYLLDSYF